jgi:hypothetical protein
LGLAALRRSERAIHHEDDGNPRDCEVSEKQTQENDQTGSRGNFDFDIVPDAGRNQATDYDENDVEDEGFHGNFQIVVALAFIRATIIAPG